MSSVVGHLAEARAAWVGRAVGVLGEDSVAPIILGLVSDELGKVKKRLGSVNQPKANKIAV